MVESIQQRVKEKYGVDVTEEQIYCIINKLGNIINNGISMNEVELWMSMKD